MKVCVCGGGGSNVEENEFESFMSKLKGKSKKHFVALLEQLGEANDMIEAHEDTIVGERSRNSKFSYVSPRSIYGETSYE